MTARYIREKFGVRVRDEFISDVMSATNHISSYPNIGKEEPYLENQPIAFRSLVVRKHNKIVYFILDDHIEIAAFWDTRREPVAQASEVVKPIF